MKTIIAVLLFLTFSICASAQTVVPVMEWTSLRGTQSFFMKAVTKIDSYSNVYTAGATLNNSGDYDLLVTKYNNSGHLLWSHQYDAGVGGNDGASAMFIDAHCRVFVTGATFSSSDSSDVLTIMYDSSGTQQWVSVYSGTYHRNDGGTSILLSNDSIYVGGVCTDTLNGADFLVLKYDLSGSLQWSNVYDDVHLNDISNSIALAHADTLVIAGAAQKTSTNWAYLTVTFRASTGALLNHTNSGSSAIGFDNINAMTKDNSGNIYITGAALSAGLTDFDIHTIKLNSSLSVQWSQSYNSSGTMNDVGNDIAVDASGNVFITGYSTTSSQGTDYVTIKYNSGGMQQWVETFNGTANGADTAKAIIVDPHGNIAITGSSSSGTDEDYQTIKYDASSGAVKWQISFNNKFNRNDRAFDIATDVNSNIIIAGQSQDTSGKYTYNTIKYSEVAVTIPPDSEGVSGVIGYIENRDQLLGTDKNIVERVRFYTEKTNPALYFMDDTVSYVFGTIDTTYAPDDTLKQRRVDMWFDNDNSELIPVGKEDEYTNYFLGQIVRPRVPQYNQLYRKEVWSGTDVRYSSNNRGLKYDFIVDAGENPNDIIMYFAGYDSLYNQNDSLFITTDLGSIIYQQAEAFEIDGSGDTIQVGWQPQYKVTMNQVVFDNIGAYNNSNKLCFRMKWGNSIASMDSVDNLEWSTFDGGRYYDYFNEVKTDTLGQVYVVGESTPSGFPISYVGLAPIQINVHIGSTGNAILIKFQKNGKVDWSTYFGGNNYAEANSVAINLHGDIYIAGKTNCDTLFTFNPGGGAYYQDTLASSTVNSDDCFILKLDSTGSVALWSTYYGGSDGEAIHKINLDPQGNLYVVGETNSQDLPTNPGSYFQSCVVGGSGSDQDAFIAKFTPALDWAVCYGDTELESAYSIAVDGHGNNASLYVVGITYSQNFPTYYPGSSAYTDSTYNNVGDAFILKFSYNGDRLWSTLYGGSGTDEAMDVLVNNNGEVFVSGWTRSQDLDTLDEGGGAFYQSHNQDLYNAFLVKFSSAKTEEWATYYGGNTFTYGTAIAMDDNGYLYLTGQVLNSTLPFPSFNPSGAFGQPSSHGSTDSYIAGFDNSQQLVWTTYYGGENQEEGISIATFGSSKLYIVGNTFSKDISGGSAFPLLDGGGIPYFQPYNGSSPFSSTGWDGYIARFNLLPFSTPTKVEKIKKQDFELTVFPNPSSGKITIQSESSMQGIEIYNILGARVFSRLLSSEDQHQVNIDLSSFASGVYELKVRGGDKLLNAKIVNMK